MARTRKAAVEKKEEGSDVDESTMGMSSLFAPSGLESLHVEEMRSRANRR